MDPDQAGFALHGDAEAALTEDFEHLVVLGQDVGLEDGHSVLVGRLGKTLQQERAEAAALIRVRDREVDLRPIGGGPVVARLSDHVLTVDRHYAAVLAALDPGPASGRGFEVGRLGAEAEPLRRVGEAAQECQNRRLVGRPGRPYAHRRTVTQDCVDVAGGVARAHAVAFACDGVGLRGPNVGRPRRSGPAGGILELFGASMIRRSGE